MTTGTRRSLGMAAAVLLLRATCSSAFSSGFSTRSARAAAPISAGKTDLTHLESSTPTARRKQQEAFPSPPLQMICDEQKEFEMALGKALDTLRKDYPDVLTSCPDFSIYHDNLETIDPTGVKLHGIRGYKTSFKFLHAFVNFFYCPSESGLTFRLVYDWARKHIRVSWNAVLVPKRIYGGVRNLLHVDGISVYELDRASGLITQHRIEKLIVNDAPVRPVNGIFDAMENLVRVDPKGVPVLGMKHEERNPFIAEFRGADLFSNMLGGSHTSLFSVSDASNGESAAPDGQSDESPFDQDAFERKNMSRKKFGLPPLTVQEFMEVQAQVRKMEMSQRQKAANLASAAELSEQQKKEEGVFSKMFGSMMKDTCESNWDCERPEVCCDLGFKKMCCSSGVGVFNGVPRQQYERILVPIPVENGDGPMPPDAF